MKTINKTLLLLLAIVITTNLYAITTKRSPENGGTTKWKGSIETPYVTATPNSGYHFVKWVLTNTKTGDIIWTRTNNPVTVEEKYNNCQSNNGNSCYTITAYFEKDKYTIMFVNYDGTPLQNSEVEYGTIPAYTGETPTKPADAQYTYTFGGWDAELVTVTGEAIYTAQFTSTLNKYAITFVNYDGTPLQSSEVEYGTIPAYTGATPTKPADEQYTYLFSGWDAELVAVTGAATYTAQFTNTLNKYLITFVNYDGTPLQSSEVEYGTIPAYTGATPTKPADAQYTYLFSGWDAELVAVTGEVTYTATFDATLNTFSITWLNEDGNMLKTSKVAYGEIPEYIGETPTKASTAEYTYEFAGWLPKIKPATEDVRYTTFFERNKIDMPKYTVNINGENCSLRISNEVPTGTTLQVEAVADECFQFQKWSDNETANPRTINVMEDANLTAEFNKLQYTITGKNDAKGGQVNVEEVNP